MALAAADRSAAEEDAVMSTGARTKLQNLLPNLRPIPEHHVPAIGQAVSRQPRVDYRGSFLCRAGRTRGWSCARGFLKKACLARLCSRFRIATERQTSILQRYSARHLPPLRPAVTSPLAMSFRGNQIDALDRELGTTAAFRISKNEVPCGRLRWNAH